MSDTPIPARWYVVDKDGLATLCKDYDDAQAVAAECFVEWPRRAPYQPVLLGDVAAAVAQERERAARLCDDLHHRWRWDDAPDSDSGPRACAAAIRSTPAEPSK